MPARSNRLAEPRFGAAGKSVALDPASPYLRSDENGLLSHGVRSSALSWQLRVAEPRRLVAELDWTSAERLANLM